jgi:hypothetical protein
MCIQRDGCQRRQIVDILRDVIEKDVFLYIQRDGIIGTTLIARIGRSVL